MKEQPLAKARLSLEGLSVGDAFGELFFSLTLPADGPARLPDGPWPWTDDTHMALSIVEILKARGEIDQDELARSFARRWEKEPGRGYGGGAARLLARIGRGEDWRRASPALFNGGSFGNGAAMRVAPVGAYFSPVLSRAAEQARLSAEVTHSHPEGAAGAMAVAVAAALAARPEHPSGAGFIEEILPLVPDGDTKAGIRRALEIPGGSLEEAAETLGTGRRVSAQDTVPFCLWIAAHNLDDYEKALWQTVRGRGDRDTTCAIVGGIVALAAGTIPPDWLKRREPLPPL